MPRRARSRAAAADAAARPEDAKRLRGFQFLSAKPLLIVLNLDEGDLPRADGPSSWPGIEDVLAGGAIRAVPICAKIELEIAQLDPEDAAAFMADLGLTNPDWIASSAPATTCSGTSRSSPSARTRTARGRFPATRRRSSPRARFTRTSRAVSFAPKSCGTSTARARIDRGVPRSRRAAPRGQGYIVLDGDVINFRHAT